MIVKIQRDEMLFGWTFVDKVDSCTYEKYGKSDDGKLYVLDGAPDEFIETVNKFLHYSSIRDYVYLRLVRRNDAGEFVEYYACDGKVFLLNDEGQTIEKIR